MIEKLKDKQLPPDIPESFQINIIAQKVDEIIDRVDRQETLICRNGSYPVSEPTIKPCPFCNQPVIAKDAAHFTVSHLSNCDYPRGCYYHKMTNLDKWNARV